MEPKRLQLDYPVKPFSINQHFAENYPCVKNFGEPNQEVVMSYSNTTCPVGYEKLYPKFGMAGHNGTDLLAGLQFVYAATDGTVIEQQLVPARGLGVGILTDEQVEMDCGVHFAKLRYWHLQKFSVNLGDKVKAGDVIGVSDNTGYSSGNHLHFELQPMDKDKGGHPKLVNPPGNIAGAVSAEPYFTGNYAADIGTKLKLVVALQSLVMLYQKLLAGKG